MGGGMIATPMVPVMPMMPMMPMNPMAMNPMGAMGAMAMMGTMAAGSGGGAAAKEGGGVKKAAKKESDKKAEPVEAFNLADLQERLLKAQSAGDDSAPKGSVSPERQKTRSSRTAEGKEEKSE